MSSSLFDTTRLEGKTVLVTGASGGIGAATAILFAKAGANLILLARREEELEKVKQLAIDANKQGGTGKGGEVVCLKVDMSKRAEIDAALAKAKEAVEDIEVLVNNAGFVKGVEKVGDINPDDIDAMFATNVVGLIHLTQAVVKSMKARQTGHIIQLGSIAGREPYAGGSIYCATKHAVRAFSTAMMKELVDTPIRVSEIQPGMVETEFSVTRFRGDKSAADNVYKGVQPLVAHDVAEEIVWCALRPRHVQIAEMLVFPSQQAGAGVVHRST